MLNIKNWLLHCTVIANNYNNINQHYLFFNIVPYCTIYLMLFYFLPFYLSPQLYSQSIEPIATFSNEYRNYWFLFGKQKYRINVVDY